MTNKNTPTGIDRRTPGRPADPIDHLRRVAARLHDLEKEAALLRAELQSLETGVQARTPGPVIPILAYTSAQVAEAIGVGRTIVYEMFRTGELPTFRRGDGIRRVLVEDLVSYLRANRDTTTGTGSDADAGAETAGATQVNGTERTKGTES